jgi:hypothetical protein
MRTEFGMSSLRNIVESSTRRLMNKAKQAW